MARHFIVHQPDAHAISGKEWLVTNGIGGYASSTISGANTRRYHGLLVAALDPPTDRRVLVSKVEEKVITTSEEFFLSTNSYVGTVHPEGYQYLSSFSRMPMPKSVFSKGKHTITKTIWMRYGQNTTIVEYSNAGEESILLDVTPLLVCRDYHSLFHEDPRWTFETKSLDARSLEVKAGKESPPVYISFTQGIYYPEPRWYRQFEYAWEKERGLDAHEDAHSIGRISCMLAPWETVYLIFSDQAEHMEGDPVVWKEEEELRLKALATSRKERFINDLAISGDQFLVHRQSSDSDTLIAGYHWFTDWGRDTMIAMRGLVITTGRKDVAQSILRTFFKYLDGGMIPNRFPDQGETPEYNTLDATLWMFVALYEYYEKFRDAEFIRGLYSKLTQILYQHYKGTRYNMHVTPEGLLYGGEKGVQLTWMDAKVDGYVVTPRIGCPVEINALWYNALCIYVYFGKELGSPPTQYVDKAKDLQQAFRKYFINPSGYLNDVVIPGQAPDGSIRPNQIYAVSLPFSPLTRKEARQVLEVVYEHLYTEYGLRSLSPQHPDYKSEFTGGPWARDNAYHQGTVWSHLWGEYALAHLKVHGYSEEARQWVRDHSRTLEQHFYQDAGLHAISENFDGENPSQGKGCIHQAWSVGMTLLALWHANT